MKCNEELEKIDFRNPFDQNIPEIFMTDEWDRTAF